MKPKSALKKNIAKASAAEVAPEASGQPVKVLAMLNENSTLLGVLSYLRKRDCQVKMSHTLMDGIRELTNFKPQILLVSWNLKNTDIKKVHSVITQKFPAICFILGEDDSTKSAAAILSSGLPNTILYPVGGVQLYNRIQVALGRPVVVAQGTAATPKKKPKLRDKTLIAGVEYKRPKKSEIPQESVWHVRVNSPNQANQIWETVVYKGGKPQYYYYKGDKPPDKWLISPDESAAVNDRAYIFLSETPATSDILSSFSDYSESVNFETEHESVENIEEIENDGFDLPEKEEKLTPAQVSSKQTPAKPEVPPPVLIEKPAVVVPEVKAKVEVPKPVVPPVVAPLKVETPKVEQAKVGQTLLEKSVNNAIALAMQSEVKSFEAPILIDEVSNFTVSVIKSSQFKGYLVSGQASDVSNPKFMKKVFDNLGKEMQKQNEALSTLCGVLELKLDAVPFKKWAKEKADFIIQSQIGNEEILFGFVPVDDLPQNFIDEDLVPVPIERFEENKILYFDIFIHMPMNNKHILYLRNGAVFTKLSKDRLLGYNTKVLYVKKTDENLFFAYSARNVFERSPINRSIPLPIPAPTKKPA